MLRPRRPAAEVSSTFLWRAAWPSRCRRPRPWQRLRPCVLLFLQLLAVALLALAVADPVRVTDAPLAEHTVFIVDASGSMAATDGEPGPPRRRPRTGPASCATSCPAGGVASVVVAGDQPRVVLTASPDPDAFADALGAVEHHRRRRPTSPTPSPWPRASRRRAPTIGFVLLSDGGLTDAEQRLLPPGTDYESVGDAVHQPGHHPARRRAPGQRAARPGHASPTPAAAAATQDRCASTSTARTGRTERGRPRRRGEPSTSRSTCPPATGSRPSSTATTCSTPTTTPTPPPRRRRGRCRCSLAGPDRTRSSSALLAAMPTASPSSAATSVRPGAGADLAIYDRVAVPADPGAPFLAIAPPGRRRAGVDRRRRRSSARRSPLVRPDDPLLAGLDLSEVGDRRGPAPRRPGGRRCSSAPRARRCSCGARSTGRPSPTSPSPWPTRTCRCRSPSRSSSTGSSPTWPAPPCRPPTSSSATPPRRARRPRPPSTAPGGASVEVGRRRARPDRRPPRLLDRSPASGRPERVVAVNADPGESSLAPARPACPSPARAGGPASEPATGRASRCWRWVVVAAAAVLAAELVVGRRRRGVGRRQWRAGRRRSGPAIAALLVGALVGLAVAPAGRPGGHRVPRRRVRLARRRRPGRGASTACARRCDASPTAPWPASSLFGGDARLELTVQPDARLDCSRRPRSTPPAPTWPAPCGWPAPSCPATPAGGSSSSPTAGPPTATPPPRPRRLGEAGIAGRRPPRRAGRGADLAVAAVDAPSHVREGESFDVRATIVVDARPGPGQLRWTARRRGGRRAGRRRRRRPDDVVAFPRSAGDGNRPRPLPGAGQRRRRRRAGERRRLRRRAGRGPGHGAVAEGDAGRGRRPWPRPSGRRAPRRRRRRGRAAAARPARHLLSRPCSSTSTPAACQPTRSPPWRPPPATSAGAS